MLPLVRAVGLAGTAASPSLDAAAGFVATAAGAAVGALAAVFWLDMPVSKLLLVLLALACPLSHLLLGHGTHGGHGHSAESAHQHATTPTAPLASTREYQAPQ